MKSILIGLDGIVPSLLEKFAAEGILPNLDKLMKTGAYGEILTPHPTLTASNWTSIATGAWPGTHGITDWNVHHPGEPLDIIHSGYNSDECSSEYLWNSAERGNKKCILLKYPASWPPTISTGIQVDGCGPTASTYETHHIGNEAFFSTEILPMSHLIELVEVENMEPKVLQSSISLTPIKNIVGKGFETETRRTIQLIDKAVEYKLFVHNSCGEGFDKIVITNNQGDKITELKNGEWSNWVKENFDLGEGIVEGTFRFKLLELSKDGKNIKLYSTDIKPIQGFTFPDAIGKDLVDRFGGFLEDPGFTTKILGLIDDETSIELMEYQNEWFENASKHLIENYEWDLLFLHAHAADYTAHLYMNLIDPMSNPDEKTRNYHLNIFRRIYKSLDSMIGTILESAGKDTLVTIVSDHGQIAVQPQATRVDINHLLNQAELLSFKPGDEEDEDDFPETIGPPKEVDWTKTKAVTQRSCHVYVNLKGRDPDGIVEPEEYEEIRDKIIETLLDYKHPKTGKRAFAMAMRNEDAKVLGSFGDKVGDIVYAWRPGYDHDNHGTTLSTAKSGIGSMGAILIMAGPGIKKGHRIESVRWLIDVAPTIAHLIDVPVPRNADGSIIYDILEDPDMKLKEKMRFKKELERWKTAFEKLSGISHTRNERL